MLSLSYDIRWYHGLFHSIHSPHLLLTHVHILPHLIGNLFIKLFAFKSFPQTTFFPTDCFLSFTIVFQLFDLCFFISYHKHSLQCTNHILSPIHHPSFLSSSLNTHVGTVQHFILFLFIIPMGDQYSFSFPLTSLLAAWCSQA